MTSIQFPLNDVQLALLRLTEDLQEKELEELKQLIIAFKARRLALLVDQVWEDKGWTNDTMQQFLDTHMRPPYLSQDKHNQ
jgi:hypothetical protein